MQPIADVRHSRYVAKRAQYSFDQHIDVELVTGTNGMTRVALGASSPVMWRWRAVASQTPLLGQNHDAQWPVQRAVHIASRAGSAGGGEGSGGSRADPKRVTATGATSLQLPRHRIEER